LALATSSEELLARRENTPRQPNLKLEASMMSNCNMPRTLQEKGCMLIGAMTAAIGILSLYTGDFAYTWMPVPGDVPGRSVAARVVGAILIAASALLLIPRTLRQGVAAMVAVFALWLVPHLPGLLSGQSWLGFFEFLLPLGAFLALMGLLASQRQPIGASRRVVVGRLCFGVGLIGCGASHFVYADFAAQMIPEWIPGRLFFTYLTGAGHIAAGVSLITGVMMRVSTALLCFMLACFVVLLHLPRVLTNPGSRLEWTMMFVAILFNGAAWVIASLVRSVEVAGAASAQDSPKASVPA
jgi:uncharacterized membrane protein